MQEEEDNDKIEEVAVAVTEEPKATEAKYVTHDPDSFKDHMPKEE